MNIASPLMARSSVNPIWTQTIFEEFPTSPQDWQIIEINKSKLVKKHNNKYLFQSGRGKVQEKQSFLQIVYCLDMLKELTSKCLDKPLPILSNFSFLKLFCTTTFNNCGRYEDYAWLIYLLWWKHPLDNPRKLGMLRYNYGKCFFFFLINKQKNCITKRR